MSSNNPQITPMSTTGTVEPNAEMKEDSKDVSSILARIKALEEEKKMMAEKLASNDAKYAKLQEAKKAEMEAMMNNTISKWLEALETPDEKSKELLKNGLTDLVSRADENAVWNVIACASAGWAANVNRLEELQGQINDYKEKEKRWNEGAFDSESSRVDVSDLGKRKADDISESEGHNIWNELENMMKEQGGGRVFGI